MNVLGERYLCGTPNEEVRTPVPFVEAGNIPRLHLPWIDELDGELQLRENLLDLATAIRHVDIYRYNDMGRWGIGGRRGSTSEETILMWGNSGAVVRVP